MLWRGNPRDTGGADYAEKGQAILHLNAVPVRPGPAGAPVRMLTVLTLAVLAAVAVTACGSSSSSSAAVAGTATHQDCVAVGDVLSDGPDPGSDPIGYAQAQILPLRKLKIADTSLRRAVQALASADQTFSSSGGSAGAAQVPKAEKAVSTLCPGVAN